MGREPREERPFCWECIYYPGGMCPACEARMPASKIAVRKEVVSCRRVGWFTWELMLECGHSVRVTGFRRPSSLKWRCEKCGEEVQVNEQ